MVPTFIYFDMGNVLLHFSHERAARQMAELAGVDFQRVWDLVFAGDLENRCERGELTPQGLHDIFCRETSTACDFECLDRAGSDIFMLNTSMVPLVAHLAAAGHRLGVLSNTSESHWRFVTQGQYWLLPGPFEQFVLSFTARSMKPEPAIYEQAIRQANVPAEQIFFTDDRPENVAAARQIGIDAVPFVSAAQIASELRRRGIVTNY